MIVLREESLAVGRFAATPPKWLRSPETNPLFNENNLLDPLFWVRFPKRTHLQTGPANDLKYLKIRRIYRNSPSKTVGSFRRIVYRPPFLSSISSAVVVSRRRKPWRRRKHPREVGSMIHPPTIPIPQHPVEQKLSPNDIRAYPSRWSRRSRIMDRDGSFLVYLDSDARVALHSYRRGAWWSGNLCSF
jgi:hypothetical protein